MQKARTVKGGVAAAKGFRVAGVAAGVRRSGRNDVAVIFADAPCETAAVFTTNKVAAAPVLRDRALLKGGVGSMRAIVANSGFANACTGDTGLRDAELCAMVAAGELGVKPGEVLVASTGVIGRRLPADRVAAGVKAAAKVLGSTYAHGLAAAQAVMTTDTKPKQACAKTEIGGKTVTVGGMTKGSGMIEPNMATMLGFITTDAAISRRMLRKALLAALAKSFNRVVVDGDESTNDSLFLMASGAAGNPRIEKEGPDYDSFLDALETVCVSLAKQMAADGEGATKFVTVTVKGAKSAKDAELAARAVARSPLAKTSWYGRDPNWGRVLAAVGYSGADVSDMKSEVFYDRVWAFRRGEVAGEAQLKKLEAVMKKPSFTVTVDLHLGDYDCTIYTCDISNEYVHINADYTT